MFYVYRQFDSAGVLLYVGFSVDVKRRMRAHRTTSSWRHQIATVTSELFLTRKAALFAERRAIVNEHPLFNATHGDTVKRAAENNQIVALVKSGLTYREISRIMGINRVSICNRIKSLGLLSKDLQT